jgi:hypothetical protein
MRIHDVGAIEVFLILVEGWTEKTSLWKAMCATFLTSVRLSLILTMRSLYLPPAVRRAICLRPGTQRPRQVSNMCVFFFHWDHYTDLSESV